MAFKSHNLYLLIASPSDLKEERDAVKLAISDWNDLHAEAEGITLMARMWETHSMPEYGVSPQQAINRQLVDKADLLIGLFWTKLGTNTEVAESGTVEEINQIVAAGKPAMVYFSTKEISPDELDLEQVKRLRDFKAKTFKNALVGTFSSPDDLRHQLARNLLQQVRHIKQSLTQESAKDDLSTNAKATLSAADDQWKKFNDDAARGDFFHFASSTCYLTYAMYPLHPTKIDLRNVDDAMTALPMIRSADRREPRSDHIRVLRKAEEGEHFEQVIVLYRDGRIQAVQTIPKIYSAKLSNYINFFGTQGKLIEIAAKHLSTLRRLGLTGPIRLQFALRRLDGRPLYLGQRAFFGDIEGSPDKPDIEPEPVIIPADFVGAKLQQMATIWRPAFDSVWQDMGAKECPYFNTDGEYDFEAH